MLGFNGGLMGVRRTPTTSSASGLWFQNEQSVARRAAIWPIAGGDPYWTDVSLLLHMDGSNGSTTFTDSSGSARSITAFGNTSISTAQSKFGGSSAYFDGSGDSLTTTYVTTAFDWWSSDFTIEAWVYASSWSGWSGTSTGTIPSLIGNMDRAGGTAYWSFGPDTNSKLKFFYFNGGEVHTLVTTANVPLDQWVHVCAVKNTSGVTLYIDGTSSGGTNPANSPISSTSVPLTIGSFNNNSITGYVDELRITKGTARYTANFTPPTAAFPDF